MSINICTVIEGSTLPTFLTNLKKDQALYKMIELRTDFIKGIKVGDVKKLKAVTKVTSIFTCRHVSEGGQFKGTAKEQADILKAALSAGFDYVDIAWDNPLLFELTESQRKKLFISFHDFKGTPASIELLGMIQRMREESPAIIKISTLVKTTKDIYALLEILRQKREKEKIVVIGMGDLGRLTRAMFPLLGSYLTYTSENTKLVKGIMKTKELQSIYKIIAKS